MTSKVSERAKPLLLSPPHAALSPWEIQAIVVGVTTKHQGRWVNTLETNLGSGTCNYPKLAMHQVAPPHNTATVTYLKGIK